MQSVIKNIEAELNKVKRELKSKTRKSSIGHVYQIGASAELFVTCYFEEYATETKKKVDQVLLKSYMIHIHKMRRDTLKRIDRMDPDSELLVEDCI
jgi:hypothetical protein